MTEQNPKENLTEELLPEEQVDQESQQLGGYCKTIKRLKT